MSALTRVLCFKALIAMAVLVGLANSQALAQKTDNSPAPGQRCSCIVPAKTMFSLVVESTQPFTKIPSTIEFTARTTTDLSCEDRVAVPAASLVNGRMDLVKMRNGFWLFMKIDSIETARGVGTLWAKPFMTNDSFTIRRGGKPICFQVKPPDYFLMLHERLIKKNTQGAKKPKYSDQPELYPLGLWAKRKDLLLIKPGDEFDAYIYQGLPVLID